MTTEAAKALTQIRALRKYNALPQTKLAERWILKRLCLADLTAVVTALESTQDTAVNRG
jgi:hypothetical protein